MCWLLIVVERLMFIFYVGCECSFYVCYMSFVGVCWCWLLFVDGCCLWFVVVCCCWLLLMWLVVCCLLRRVVVFCMLSVAFFVVVVVGRLVLFVSPCLLCVVHWCVLFFVCY